jgi:hypothetical protein
MKMLALLPLATPLGGAWAAWQRGRLMRCGMPLTPAQQDVAMVVGVAEPRRIRIAFVDRVPLPGGPLLERIAQRLGLPGADVAGLTLGHGIFIRGDTLSTSLLAHECRHVQQVEAAGSLRAFLGEYLRQVARHGYADAPFEADARTAARAACERFK